MRTLFLIIFTFCSLFAHAQVLKGNVNLSDPNQKQVIVLKDGGKIVGSIQTMDKEQVKFLFNGSVLNVPVKDIEYIAVEGENQAFSEQQDIEEPVQNQNDAQELHPQENYKDLVVSQTGYLVPKGKFSYDNKLFLVNNFNFGVTKNLNIQCGVYGFVLPYLGLKVGHEFTPQFSMSANSNVVYLSMENNIERAFMLNSSANFTFGKKNKFFNLSLGVVNDFQVLGQAYVGIGGQFEMSKKVTFLTDVVISRSFSTKNGYTIISPTFAFRIKTRGGRWDFGLLPFNLNINHQSYNSERVFAALPYVAYGINF